MMLSLFFTQSIYKLKLNAINLKKLGGAHAQRCFYHEVIEDKEKNKLLCVLCGSAVNIKIVMS